MANLAEEGVILICIAHLWPLDLHGHMKDVFCVNTPKESATLKIHIK